MPQYLTPKTALPLVVTGKALNRYTNILPNPVNPDRDGSSDHMVFALLLEIPLTLLFFSHPSVPNHRLQGTRVVLDDEHEPKTDVSTYINANYVPR